MEPSRSYVERGRASAALPGAELEAKWMDAFRAVCQNSDSGRSRQMRDAGAELDLRKIAQRCHLLKNLMPAGERN